ncbi:MAG: glycoside hydrolase family 99-like domain-containing protein, partial [Flavisolibacter sp.]
PPGAGKIAEAIACGFDVLTSYNDHESGFETGQVSIPIEKLTASTEKIWEQFKNASLPYIPAVTLGWDHRPWDGNTTTPYYTGYSESSVFNSIRSVSDWLNKNPDKTPGLPLTILYSWNEYGEGAWLTPSELMKDSLLQGVKRALRN